MGKLDHGYPLVNVYITHFEWLNPRFLWPFSMSQTANVHQGHPAHPSQTSRRWKERCWQGIAAVFRPEEGAAQLFMAVSAMWNHDFFRGYPKILFINHGLLIWDWHYCNICLFWFGFGFWELHDSWVSALFLEQRNRSCLGPHVRNAQLFLAACSLLRSRKKRCFLQQLRSNTRV